jgi:hypothetical protein
MCRQLWGYRVEEKIYLGVCKQKSLNIAGIYCVHLFGLINKSSWIKMHRVNTFKIHLVPYNISWLIHAYDFQLDDAEYDIPPVDCTPTLESILNNSEDCTSLSDDEMSNSVVPTAEVSLQLLRL